MYGKGGRVSFIIPPAPTNYRGVPAIRTKKKIIGALRFRLRFGSRPNKDNQIPKSQSSLSLIVRRSRSRTNPIRNRKDHHEAIGHRVFGLPGYCPAESGIVLFRSLPGPPGYEIKTIGPTKKLLTTICGLQLVIETLNPH
jgi:hypothetical protein